MRNPTGLCVVAFVIAIRGLAQEPPAVEAPARAVRAEIDAYYKDWQSGHPWRKRLGALDSGEEAVRQPAIAYFVELLRALDDDQANQRSQLRPDPAWGKGSADLAMELRQQIVDELGKSGAPECNLEVLRGVAENDHTPRVAIRALSAITVRRSKQATDLLVELVDGGRLGPDLMIRALRTLEMRATDPGPEAITRCLHSHRRSLREAAKPAAKRLGLEVPAGLDGDAAFDVKECVELMKEVERLVGPALPKDGGWVELEPAQNIRTAPPGEAVVRQGWLVRRTANDVEIETPFGYRRTFRLENDSPAESMLTFRVKPVPVELEVARVVAIRRSLSARDESKDSKNPFERVDRRGELSEWGSITSQFEVFDYSLYEVLLGFRLYQQGRRDLAARLLLPVIDATPDDADFLYFIQSFLGDALGHRMLAAFCMHDVEGALTLARRLAADFPRCRFHDLAKRMQAELPDRQGDWKAFRLPAEEEWRSLASTMSREEQIRYLCARTRLVVSVSSGIILTDPDWVDQTRDAPAVDHRATELIRSGMEKVINPLKILASGPLPPHADGSGEKGVDAGDFELLRTCAQEDWLVPCVSAWRYFHPMRYVATTRSLIENLIAEVQRK